MRAIDTNVVVRLLVADDADQAQAARQIVLGGETFLGVSVVLETEWVLRAGYDFTAPQIVDALRALGGLPGLTMEEPEQVAMALEGLEQGMDFADALHLARSGHCREFVTFDRKLAKRAKGLSRVPVLLL
ncbi:MULTISPECIES: type II toxin-antitoxin system VapC family toxin [Novosphingobium]|uniref:PilT protein n=1 Tax=Novosphingobium nitrogenifigens DSM 19370 TaxID=983920 RepID=F1Z4M6_9SPHN|nr:MULTISPECIES: type II toxin-antitoxin system VapC family toxin [Novosphingobium]EGD60437.1 PilT protein [Novosphingobium nitrogenifigens DSM 19370]MBF5091028.1 type II toxin-antitoxin system VapC family toxin [Novosphingobium sp. NBM11]